MIAGIVILSIVLYAMLGYFMALFTNYMTDGKSFWYEGKNQTVEGMLWINVFWPFFAFYWVVATILYVIAYPLIKLNESVEGRKLIERLYKL